MSVHELAGKPAPRDILVNVPRLVSSYYSLLPDPADRSHRIAFGTSGHRGSSLKCSFNEGHILAIVQAVVDYRKSRGIDGPLFVGKDTHALAEPAFVSTLEVLAANDVDVRIQAGGGYTPTPVVSHAILTRNRGRRDGRADGIIITPSHNPPADGGIKYNPPSGGPAAGETTSLIEARANEILAGGLKEVRRIPFEKARRASTTKEYDYVSPYIDDLRHVVDMDAIAGSGISIGVDPMGGSSVAYWEPMAERYGLNLELVNPVVDPTFSFMTVDRDGKIRMDCSSPWAMASLIELRDRFDIAFGNDADADRHGIVTRSSGLMNPNHYLSAAIAYLFTHRPEWGAEAAIGKTLVSSSMIDRVAEGLGRAVVEVPVGFKWFVDGLLDGTLGFGGEESAGASFLRRNGGVWTTDKDGIILDLLAAEMTAVTGEDPSLAYGKLQERFGSPVYERLDAPATTEQKQVLKNLTPEMVTAGTLAGEEITAILTKAPGNDSAIGGLKVVTKNGWFAARPSGTEEIYKIYAESFSGEDHLRRIQDEARDMVAAAFTSAGL